MNAVETKARGESFSSGEDDELTRVLADYLGEIESGRPVDPEEWINRHPAIGDRLRNCLKGLHLVEEFAGSLGALAKTQDGDSDGPTLGDFRIVRSIGRGGMGVVYEAVEGSLGRRVALKVLPFAAAIDPRRLARFRVESQAAAGLHNPHIIPIYSVGSEGGVHYYAMQLIEGSTLAEIIHEQRMLRDSNAQPADAPRRPESSSFLSGLSSRSLAFYREAARFGMEAAGALEHAHEHGVLHRDVKPSNLMVDSTGHLWVADFGLARFQSDSSLTVSGDILGTLRYMSPEQALANRGVVDQRTDVYSLGATLYELITLEPPFDGSNRQELFRKISQDEPRRPRALVPSIPRDLETIVLKAMAKEPAGRYTTAIELALDLERFLDDQPIRARRPGQLERLNRLARKHMAVMLSVVPLLLLIVAGLAIGIALVLAEQRQILAQQSELRTKKTEAERSQAQARRQRDRARRVVDEMYTTVASDWLSKQTNLQPLQRAFLEKALAHYEEFAAETGAEPEVRIAAAWANHRVADIERRFDRLAEAERSYRRAIGELETLGAGMPPTPDLLEPLAGCYAGLGEVLDDTGRAAESATALEHSTALRRQLIKTIPETPENASTLATRYEELGTSLGRSADYREAQAAYEKAIQLGTKSGEAGEFTHSRSTSNLAIILQKQGRLGGASRLYRQAVEQFELLVKREPRVPLYRERLALALLNLGQSLAVNSKEVEPIFRRAAAGFDRLASESIGVAENRRNLAISLLNLAAICSNAGRLREGLMLALQANDLLEDLVEKTPTFVRNRELRAKSVVRLARFRGQLGEIMTARSDANHARDLFAEMKPKDPDLLWEEGCNLGYLAHLEETLKNFKEADRLWRQTIEKFEVVVKEAPARIDYRGDFGAHILRLALSSQRLGQNALAEGQFKRSVEILEHIIDEEPERAADRLRLAQAAGYLGYFLHNNERYYEADRFNRIAYKSYERLFFEGYQQEAMVRGCADAMANIALLSLSRGRLAEGNDYYSHALKLFDSLPPKLALDPTIRETRANALDNLGACLKRVGKFNEAEPRIRQAKKIRETLVADFPDSADHRDSLGLSCAHLGEILAKKGQPAEARTLLEQAVALGERALKDDPRNAGARHHLRGSLKALASTLLEQNLPEEGAAVTRRLLGYADPAARIELLTEVGSNFAECARLAASESKEASNDREARALSYATDALGAFKEATALSKRSGPTMINLAWFRLVSPAADLRDPALALELMREASGKSPRDPLCSAMLGVALYHNGELKPALAEFEKSRQLDLAKFGVWDFYAAMTHWRLGQKSEARACFDRAEHWMDTNPTAATYRRIRASASALLELPDSAKTVHSVAKPAAPGN